MKKNNWMTKPIGNREPINYKCREEKRKDSLEKEGEECAENQQSARYNGYYCHQHAKMARTEHDKCKEQMKNQKEYLKKLVDGPDHCIHCDEEPCIFIQIVLRLCESDRIIMNALCLVLGGQLFAQKSI
jgi:hypothetical protein